MDDENLPTAAAAKPKAKMGRPVLAPEDRTIPWSVRLTEAELELLNALGGKEWLRETLRNAEWPSQEVVDAAPPDSVGTDASMVDQ